MIAQVLRFLDFRNRVHAGVLVVFMLFNSFAEALSLGLILPVLSVVANPSGIEDNRYLAWAYDFVGADDPSEFITIMVAVLIAVFVVKNLLVCFLQYSFFAFTWNNVTRVSRVFVDGYLHQPFAFHLATSNADIIRNVIFSIPIILRGMVLPLLQITSEVFVIVALIAVLALVAPLSALSVLAGLGLVMALIYKGLKSHTTIWGSHVNESSKAMLATLEQTLSGIKEIKVMGREDYFHDRFAKVVAANSQARIYFYTANQTPRLILEVVLVSALLIALATFVQSGATLVTMVPILGLYGIAAMRLLPSFNRIATYLNGFDFNKAALNNLIGDLDTFAATARAAPPETREEIDFNESLEFSDVSFSYAGRDGAALNGLQLSISKGEWVAIVGPSGAGKTTLANILLGLLHPDGGQIFVDGKPVRTESRRWRHRIGFIPQDTFVLHDTFARNVAFGEEADAIDESRLKDAIKAAQLDAVIRNLPDGMDTVIGTGGVSLSGGEAQRMAIARALYHGAEILIMDEPTSALDAETEKAVVSAIARLAGDKTIITIAHRLSTIRRCDRIFMVENGRVTAVGPFGELARKNHTFQRMVKAMGIEKSEPDGIEG